MTTDSFAKVSVSEYTTQNQITEPNTNPKILMFFLQKRQPENKSTDFQAAYAYIIQKNHY